MGGAGRLHMHVRCRACTCQGMRRIHSRHGTGMGRNLSTVVGCTLPIQCMHTQPGSVHASCRTALACRPMGNSRELDASWLAMADPMRGCCMQATTSASAGHPGRAAHVGVGGDTRYPCGASDVTKCIQHRHTASIGACLMLHGIGMRTDGTAESSAPLGWVWPIRCVAAACRQLVRRVDADR